MNAVVGIIDYGMCNIFSVANACEAVGLDYKVISSMDDFDGVAGIILPGVGAFESAIDKIKDKGFDRKIKDLASKNFPMMGICLGHQLLFESSDENGKHDGLGIFKGSVKRIPKISEKIKVPHINWEKCHFAKSDSKFLKNIKDTEYMYFVHSYYVEPTDKSIILTNSNYLGFEFCSSVEYQNIVSFQFHPEKSAKEGLKIYSNFKEVLEKYVRE